VNKGLSGAAESNFAAHDHSMNSGEYLRHLVMKGKRGESEGQTVADVVLDSADEIQICGVVADRPSNRIVPAFQIGKETPG
jgi:hypothetical protein